MVNYDKLPAASKFFDGKLYEKMNEDLQLAGMAKRTVHGYLRAVRQLADYCERRPNKITDCLLYTSPSPRDATLSRMPSSA